MIRAFSIALLVACGTPKEKADARPPDAVPAPGSAAFSWSVTQAGSASDCASVNGGRVVIRYRPTEGIVEEQVTFACTAGQGVVTGLSPSLYVFWPRLDAANGGAAIVEVLVSDVQIEAGQTTTVPPVVFDVP